jgi:peptide-methionine (R)-S-oxide reductase
MNARRSIDLANSKWHAVWMRGPALALAPKEADAGLRSPSKGAQLTRRELLGMTSVGVIAIAVGGRYIFTRTTSDAPETSVTVAHSDAQWRELLSAGAYQVLRHGATEAPYSSGLLKEHRNGIFSCAGCEKQLFDSRTKYDSRTGWPSFWDVMAGAISRHEDRSIGMSRTEVRCAQCGGHLGHVFDDGPKPTGLRYCMNGIAMIFEPKAT